MFGGGQNFYLLSIVPTPKSHKSEPSATEIFIAGGLAGKILKYKVKQSLHVGILLGMI